ncbi:MAG: YibE/F family protein [Armatimonadota bacterium]|nr:YibE/F family protein [Armatimonadota bacterium]MDR7497575.1 YibE/F family protein [Armatimonadota bacterium]MDR7512686.1 YibE/F family protein [Armatimonadota bacterium]
MPHIPASIRFTRCPAGGVAFLLTLTLLAAVAFGGPLVASPAPSDPSAPFEEFSRGVVAEVTREARQDLGWTVQVTQSLRVRLRSGDGRGRTVEATYAPPEHAAPLRPGDAVLLIRGTAPGGPAYEVVDRDRLVPLAAAFALFVAAALAFSRWQGATALLGLGISLLVLARFVVPRILAGEHPLGVTLAGAVMIALTSIYLAHGANRRTTVALAGLLVTLAAAAGLAILFVSLARLSGAGSEEAVLLQVGHLAGVNLRGLLLGGILLGALGVLDDITTAQAAAVEEISRANPSLGPTELYRRGLSVGREHITALVNTLVLAYAGASLPLFLLFTINPDQPLWVTLNTEFVAEEIVRTLVGSIALVLAVPVTTLLAARFLRGPSGPGQPVPGHSH